MPTLIIFCGLPGVGKTHLCRELKGMIDCAFFDSDELARNSPLVKKLDRGDFEKGEMKEIRSKYYDKKVERVRSLLEKNEIVIMDAVAKTKNLREKFYKMVDDVGADLILVKVEAPEKITRERIKEDGSKRKGTSVESRLKIYEKSKENWEPIERDYFLIDTSKENKKQLKELIERYGLRRNEDS